MRVTQVLRRPVELAAKRTSDSELHMSAIGVIVLQNSIAFDDGARP